MPGNLFDDALAHLDANAEAAGGSATAPASTSVFDQALGVLDRQNQVQQTRIKSSLRQATETTPEKAAEARRLSLKFAVPPQMILRNFDDYQRRATTAQSLTPLQQDTPHLASWLEDPENAAVAHDDMPPMGAIEKQLGWSGKILGAVKAGYYGIGAGLTGAVTGAAEYAIRSGQVQYEAEYGAPERASYGLRADQTTQKGEGFFGPLRRPDGGVMTEFSIADSENPQLRGPKGEYLDYPTLVPTLTPEEVQTLLNLPEGEAVPQTIKDKAEAFALNRLAEGKPVFASPTEQQRNLYPHLTREGLPSDALAAQPETILQLHLIRQHLQEKAEEARGQRGTGVFERGALGAVESLTQSAVLLPLSIMTGSPAPLLAGMGLSTGGTTYGQTRDAGGSVALSAVRGGFDATVEVATEYVPAKWFLGDLASNAPLRTVLFHQLAGEVPGEEIAIALQDFSEWATLHPETGIMEYVKARPGAFTETLIATVVAAGVQSGGARLAAASTQKLITGLGQAASTSKTAKRSPEAVEHFVAQATADSPTKAVYAPIETWTTYWQSKGEDPAKMAADLTGDAQAYSRAVELGTDLEIPLAKYAAKLAPTEHNAFFANELRLDPADMNAREAAAYAESVQQQAQPAEPTQPQPIEQATQLMVDRMVAQGIPQETAQTYGAIWGAGIGTLASNFGIDPVTLQAQYGPGGGPTITREGVPTTPTGVPAEAPPEEAPEGVPAETPTPEAPAPDTILAPRFRTEQVGDVEVQVPVDQPPIELAQGPNPSDFLQPMRRDFFAKVRDQLMERERNAPRQLTPAAQRVEYERQAIENNHPFVVYDADGTRREISEREEFGYEPKEGETLGVETPDGFRVLADNGGKLPERVLYQEKRAQISISADRQFNIHLLEHADLSSFLHEGAHFFLEVFGDLTDQLTERADTTLTPEQQRLRDDYAALLSWLGVESRGQVTTEQHEQFARGFEAYLMEGKAPSVELRSAFARARAWLLGIYRNLRNLRVTLTPEVRDVFDRLLATDAAIQQAQQQASVSGLFTTAEQAGMSEQEFATYRGRIEDASRKAKEELDRQLLAEVHREQTATWKAQREAIRQQVESEVQQQPVYRVLAAMQKGTHPNGDPLIEGEQPQPLKLSKTIISNRYGAERLKALPKPYIYSRDGGLDPDSVAEMFGFSSGDALLTAVTTAQPIRSVIERETAQRMFEQHGSLLLDGTLGEKAQAAVANDYREDVVRAELRALHTLQRAARPFVTQAVKAEQKERAYERRWLEAEARLRVAIAEGHKQAEIDALRTEIADLKTQAKTDLREAERERAYERRWFEAEARLRVAIAEGRKQVDIDRLRDEVRTLRDQARGGAATIRAAIPPAAAIRHAAAEQIARTRVGNIRPQVYWAAGTKAGRQATEFAARQQFPEAIAAKQKQLYNLALYREALKALELAEDGERWVRNQDKAAGRQRLAEAGGSYLDQWDGQLDRYEFKRVPQNVLDRRARMEKWVASQKAEGLAIDLPDALLEEGKRINYRTLTVEEFIGVTDGLKQLVHFAQLKRKLLGRQAARELDDVATTVAERLYSTRPNASDAPRLTRHKSMLDNVKRYGSDLGASFLSADTLVRELDGFEDLGPVYENLKGGLDRAIIEALIPRTNAAAEAITAINSVYQRGELKKRVEIKELNDSLTREEIIAFALNWGTADNRAALLESKKWAAIGANERTAQAILDTLDKRDWDYVQSVWDYLETFWPDIEASQKRRKGVAPAKVEALPVETQFGTYRGGYYTLKYDTEGSIVAKQDEIADVLERMRLGRYAAAATKAGFAKERVGSGGRPVLLSLSVIAQHVGEVNYDLALGDEVRSIDRILRHTAVRDAFEKTGRQVEYQALELWLHDMATGELGSSDRLSRTSRRIRTGLTVSALGFNLGTAAMNIVAPAQSMVVIGKRAMLRGMVDLTSRKWFGEGNIFQQVTESSPFMAERQTTFNKDIMTAMERVGDSRVPRVVHQSVYYFITKSQWLVDMATWLGAHRKGLAQFEGNSDKATAYADRMVARAQGSGLWTDRTAIERGTLDSRTRQAEFVKMWTTLMSYMLAKGNVAYEKTASRNFKRPSEIAAWTVDMALLFSVEAAFSAIIHGQFDDDDDDWETFGTWLAETGKNVIGVVPFAREITSAIEGYPTGGPLGAAYKRIGSVYTQVEQGEFDAALIKAVNSLGGMFLKYPSSAINRVITAGTREADGEDVPLLDYFVYREDRGEARR